MDYELKYEGNDVILVMVNTHDSNFYVPEGVTKIGERCFEYNNDIKFVKLSSTVKEIGEYAFDNSRIKFISLNEGLEFIGDFCFCDCEFLKFVNLPGSVKRLGEGCFQNSNIDGIGLNEGLEVIGQNCFFNCINIENIHFPESLKRIGSDAFNGCSEIREIKIPASVEYIDKTSFTNCLNLNHIEVDKQNKVYDSRNHCNMIILTKKNRIISSCNKSIIPDSIKYLKANSFTSLKFRKLVIPNSVKRIEKFTFKECDIEELVIGANVEYIDKKAFDRCFYIKKIIVDKNNKVYMGSKENNAIIEKETCTLIRALDTYKIEPYIKTIASYAFYGLNIDIIYIPYNVECIQEEAFMSCNINKMIFGDGMYNLEFNCFGNSDIYYLELCGKVNIDNLSSILDNIVTLIAPEIEYFDAYYLGAITNIFKDKDTYRKYLPLLDLGYNVFDIDPVMNIDLLNEYENIFDMNAAELFYKHLYRVLCTQDIADLDCSYLKAYSIIGYLENPDFYNLLDMNNILRGMNDIIYDTIYEDGKMDNVIDYIVQYDLITKQNKDYILRYFDEYNNVENKAIILEKIKELNINIDTFDF